MADRGSAGGSVAWRREVGWDVGLRLGAPPHGDRLLDEVRVVQLQVANLLRDLLAHGLGLQVGNEVSHEPRL